MKPPENPFSGEHYRYHLYTLSEVAEILHVNRQTVYRMVRERHIPHVRVGEGYRVTRETLDLWMSGALDHLQIPRK